MFQTTTLAFGMPGMTEWLIIGALGLLIFGKRLPEVGKGLGQAITQFKRGLKEGETELVQMDDEPVSDRKALTQASSHRFDPYTGKPIEQDAPVTKSAS